MEDKDLRFNLNREAAPLATVMQKGILLSLNSFNLNREAAPLATLDMLFLRVFGILVSISTEKPLH